MWTDQLPLWLIVALSVWGVGAGVAWIVFGLVLYVDQELGIQAFRERSAKRMWRDITGWPLLIGPLWLIDAVLGVLLYPVVYQKWLHKRRKPYRTPYQRIAVPRKRWWYRLPDGRAGCADCATRSGVRAHLRKAYRFDNLVPVDTEINLIR